MVSSKPRAHMPASRRAKIYAPFDALKGLKEAIAAKDWTAIATLCKDALAIITEIRQK